MHKGKEQCKYRTTLLLIDYMVLLKHIQSFNVGVQKCVRTQSSLRGKQLDRFLVKKYKVDITFMYYIFWYDKTRRLSKLFGSVIIGHRKHKS